MKTIYYIEVTDTFSGEANYAWVTRHAIKGKSERGAVNRFSRLSGISWRHDYADRYNSKSGQTCLFISEFDENDHSDYRFSTDDRS